MAWCPQTTSHYLSQCCLRMILPHDIPRPECKHNHFDLYSKNTIWHQLWVVVVVVVVVVLVFPANNTAMERYNIIQNKLLEATREAIRLIGLVALIMAYKVNKCMWPTGVRGQGSDRGMHHGAKRTCRFRGVGSVLIIIKQSLQRLTGFTCSATSS